MSRNHLVAHRAEMDRRGVRMTRRTVSESRHQLIRVAYAHGKVTYRELGERFGVTRQRIEQIVKGRR